MTNRTNTMAIALNHEVTEPPRQDRPRARPERAPAAPFECRLAETTWGVLLRLEGEAGVHAVDRMSFILMLMRLVARRPPLVVVDLSGLTFLSSLAIGALVGFCRELGRFGGRVKLAA